MSGAPPAEPGIQSLDSLDLVHAFGLYPVPIRDAVISLGDDAFTFAVGRQLAVWDHVRRRLSFLPREQEGCVITAATKSASGRLLAVAERQGRSEDGREGSTTRISILGLPAAFCPAPGEGGGRAEARGEGTLKVLHPANKRLKIVGLAFTPDARHLVSISEMPETTITYWRWEVEKAVSTHEVQLPITRLHVNPKNGHQISISGPRYMRLWDFNPNDQRLRENASVFSLKQEKQTDIVDHCWLHEEGILCVATRDGHVHLFDNGDHRQDVNVRTFIAKDESQGPKALEREQQRMVARMMGGLGPAAMADPPPVCLVSLATWGRGFVVGGDQGYLGVFKVDAKCQVEGFGTFRMPGEDSFLWCMSAGSEDTQLTILSYTEKDTEGDPKTGGLPKAMRSGSIVSAGGSRHGGGGGGLVTTESIAREVDEDKERTWSLTTFPVGQADLAATGQLEVFRPVVPTGVHSGPIQGMASCPLRRLVATCGVDMQLKLWSYPQAEFMDQSGSFGAELSVKVSTYERPHSLAVHPMGFQVAVILEDMLRVYHVTTQLATRTLLDLPLKHPGDVAYSHSGALLAVTSNNDVMVIDPWKGVLVRMFSGSGGHLSIVNQVRFSEDDKMLLSCSAAPSGAIYGWDMESEAKERVFEHVSKGTDYACFQHDFRRNLCVAVTRPEGQLRMIGHLSNTLVELGGDAGSPVFTAVALAAPLGLLFAGTQMGSVRVFSWPIKAGGLAANTSRELELHAHSITSLALSTNAHLLFSACKGGTFMACEVKSVTMADGEATRMTSAMLDQRFIKYRRLEDGPRRRKPNREDERKATELQKKLTEAKTSMAANIASLDDMVMLPRSYFNELLNEIKLLEERMASLKHESEYALEQKDAEMQEKVDAINYERRHERQQHDEKYDALFTQHKRALERHQDEIRKANSEFEKRSRERQEEFENKISLEYDKQTRLFNELQGLKDQHAKEITKSAEKHHEQLTELRAANENAIREWRAEYDKVCSLLKSDGLKFEEALRQQESEYEDQISEILELKRAVLQVESEKSTTALKDGVSMKQTITMLQSSIGRYQVKLDESDRQRAELQKQLEASKEMFNAVQEQLKEEKRALKVKGESLAKIREQMKHLESFRFVLFHKVKQMEEERDPLAEQVASLKSNVREMYSEFVREFRHKQKLDQQLDDKTHLSNSVQQENVHLNRQLIQLKKDARRLLNDVEQVLHPDTAAEFERLPKRLMAVVEKHKKLSQWKQPEEDDGKADRKGENTKEQMLMHEMVIQRDLLFRKNQIAEASANQTKRECGNDLRRLTSENAALINEMNMLRTENRSLLRSCKELEAKVIAFRSKETAKARSGSECSLARADSAPDLDDPPPPRSGGGGSVGGAAGAPGGALALPSRGSGAAGALSARRGALRASIGGGAAGIAGPVPGAGETPYVRRKVVDQQELYRRQRQRGLNQLPPVLQPPAALDGSASAPLLPGRSGAKPSVQEQRFTQTLDSVNAGRRQLERQGFDIGRLATVAVAEGAAAATAAAPPAANMIAGPPSAGAAMAAATPAVAG